MNTHRVLRTVFACCLLVGMPRVGEGQSIRAAAVGFSYPTMSDVGFTSLTREPACTTNHLAFAAAGLVGSALIGGGLGSCTV